MKSIFISIFSFSMSGFCVFNMNNFNPATIGFWTYLMGVFIWTIILGFVGLATAEWIKSKRKWHGIGTGKIHSKP